MSPTLKPAYLIHGDDHGRIAERRARLRSLADGAGGVGAEVLEGERATVEATARALSTMSLAVGRRIIIVDGVERWKEGETGVLEPLLAELPAETTVAFFAREDGRVKAPANLRVAVERAGGVVSAEQAVKPWELPKWVVVRAREHGLELDAGAARALVARVGERQQRLLRELERIGLELGSGVTLGPEEIEELTGGGAQRRVWSLADALVAGDRAAALGLLLELRTQGERLGGLVYWVVQRVRLALDAVERLEAGEPAAQVKRGLRMPPRAADRLLADARRTDRDGLRATLVALADLELATRGGGSLSEETAAVLAVAALAR